MIQKFDFDSLVATEKQVSLDDLAEYQTVLREIAHDQCARPQAEILRLLERCDRDTGDLKADVQWRVQRDEQIAEIKREQEYRARNAELLAKLKSMREEFEKIETEYNTARYPIIGESDSLDEKLWKISRYRDDLYDSCRDTHLKLELETLESSFDHHAESILDKRQEQINSELRQLEYDLAEKKITMNRNEEKRDLKLKIRQLQEESQQLETKKAEIVQKKIELQQAIGAIRERMIFS